MLKTLTLSGAILALISTTVSAQVEDRWHYVGKTAELRWFVDNRSVSSGSQEFPEINAWVRIFNDDTRKIQLVEFAFNCRAQTFRAVTLVSEQNGRSYQDDVPPAPMKRPLPGTLMEDLVDTVCS